LGAIIIHPICVTFF